MTVPPAASIFSFADLEKWLNYRFRENPLDARSTIESFARYLAEKIGERKSG